MRYQGIYRDLTERLQMQEALRASQERYQVLFDACPDLLYVTDTAGRLLQANAEVLRRTGLSADALRQKTFLDFFAGENRDELLRGFTQLTRGERVRPIEVTAKNGAGQIRTFEIKGMPLVGKDGDGQRDPERRARHHRAESRGTGGARERSVARADHGSHAGYRLSV